jgi:hypothetical protein
LSTNAREEEMMRTIAKIMVVGVVLGLTLMAFPALAFEATTVVLNSSTGNPVGTGYTPTSTDDVVVFYAYGAVRPYNGSNLTDGTFGPNGESRQARVGQPIMDGMPYGSLLVQFGSAGQIDPLAQFMGEKGVLRLFPGNLNQELFVGLNMSDADLSGMAGDIVVILITATADEAQIAELTIDSNSAYPLPTGLVADAGTDQFLVIAHGAMQLTGRFYFGPEGEPKFNRAGQPLPEGPFGQLCGSFSLVTAGFPIGDGGSFKAQTVDLGRELVLYTDMSDTDQAGIAGEFQVKVIQLQVGTSSAESEAIDLGSFHQSYPNPVASSANIAFSLAGPADVELKIYDASGGLVRTLMDQRVESGNYNLIWDGRNENGRPVPSGTYFSRLTHEGRSSVEKLVVVN